MDITSEIHEQMVGALYSDQVFLVNRMKESISFQYDSRVYSLKPGEKLTIARHIADRAVQQGVIKIDPYTGDVIDSMFGISELNGDKTAFDFSPIKNLTVDQVKQSKKDGSDMEVDPATGLLVKKKIVFTGVPQGYSESNSMRGGDVIQSSELAVKGGK